MEFRIPEMAETPLAEFAKLPKQQVSKLIEAIRASKPALGIDQFAINVASKSDLELQQVGRILSMFAGMYLARIEAGKSLEEFASDLSEALKRRGNKDAVSVDWSVFAESVQAILASEDSLGVTAKALDLLTDYEHGLHSCRIITDIRHVFASDPTARPKAAVVVHMLNLVYHEIDDMKEIYIALDASDLARLKSAIERAQAKESNLRQMMKDSGVDCLEN